MDILGSASESESTEGESNLAAAKAKINRLEEKVVELEEKIVQMKKCSREALRISRSKYLNRLCLFVEHAVNTIEHDLHSGDFGNNAAAYKRHCFDRLGDHLKKKLGPDSEETQTPSKNQTEMPSKKRKDTDETTPSKKQKMLKRHCL